MSPLDRPIHAVRSRLMMQRFIDALGQALFLAAAVLLVGILLNRLVHWQVGWAWGWVAVLFAAAFLLALVRAFADRPTAHEAAVAIDQKLGLKDTLASAMAVRDQQDPVAQAVVSEATALAGALALQNRFPLRWPAQYPNALGVLVLAGLALLLPSMDLLGRQEAAKQADQSQQQQAEARRQVQEALTRIESAPRVVADAQAVQLAQAELADLLNQPSLDPEQARRTAQQALDQVEQALRREMADNRQWAQAKQDQKLFRTMPAAEQNGPVARTHRALTEGDFSQAMQELNRLAETFQQLSPEQRQEAARQMQQLAQALQERAGDPELAREMRQQLQQMGADASQAQQMQQLMRQAAQGDAQAQQQLQQMANDLLGQMNNGQGPTAQQQQAIQQMLQQMQGQANAQQAAQQMAQAAQQAAQAMQQASRQTGASPGDSQAMTDALDQVQQQLQAMEAAAQDARQIAAAQQAQSGASGVQSAGQGAGQNASSGQPSGNGPMAGQWQAGDPDQTGNGLGGAGQGQGGLAPNTPAPFGFQQEVSPSQEDETGRMIARFFVKDSQPLAGEARQQLRDVAAAAQAEQTDEVDPERVSRQARQAVRNYFQSLAEESPPPTAAP